MYRILQAKGDRMQREWYAGMQVWREYGFTLAVQAEHGKQAMEILKEQNFDLIIADVEMPFLGGLELLEQLRKNGCQTEVILSGPADFEYARKGLVLGAFDYIVEPVQERNFACIIRRAARMLSQKRNQDRGFQIVHTALEQAGIEAGKDSFIHSLCIFLAGQIHRVVTMEEAAEYAGLSKDYFGKACKAHTGMSFGALYSLIKVEHAKVMLRDSSEKTYEISERLGYASPNYFARIFKEQTGQTPSQYRAAVISDF